MSSASPSTSSLAATAHWQLRVDFATGAAIAAADYNAVGTVLPLSSTKDEDAYVGVLVAFKGVCVGAFPDGVGESAVAFVLLPPRCRRHAVRRC